MLLLIAGCQSLVGDKVTIRASDYADLAAAAWYGQCVGNTYGLAHEHRYLFEKPRTEPITGFSQNIIDRLQAANGCFSDDDTDIEYVYLHGMEKYGTTPTLEQLGTLWQAHINTSIWVANQTARLLMAQGWLPPQTGSRELNRHWAMIDPQLVNEIWAITSPGMVKYSAGMADWAARVTNDGIGTHPTIWYNVMYAAAFFEQDHRKLYLIGMESLPADSPFRECLKDILAWHDENPNDWLPVRKAVDEKWYRPPYNSMVGSLINGAMGAIALLYGEGDFRKTLNMACMAGYDADNQAATLAGIIAIAGGGMKSIPQDLLMPVAGWTEPFNNFYNNQTRDGLPSAKMTDIVARIVAQGEKRILEAGGRVTTLSDGDKLYEINRDSVFTPPFEIRLEPVICTRGEAAMAKATAVFHCGEVVWGDATGLPAGMEFVRGNDSASAAVKGIPLEAGSFTVTIDATDGRGRQASIQQALLVEKPNLGMNAEVISRAKMKQPEVIRDRNLATYFTSANPRAGFRSKERIAQDWYGYRWREAVTLRELVFTTGQISWEFPSGFDSPKVQYLDDHGQWRDALNQKMVPVAMSTVGLPGSWLRYGFTFDPVKTRAIRLFGALNGNQNYTSVAELSVN